MKSRFSTLRRQTTQMKLKKSPCSPSNSISHFPWMNRVNNGKWAAICFAMAKWPKNQDIKTFLMNGSATLKRSICFLSRPLIYVSQSSSTSFLLSYTNFLLRNDGLRQPHRLVCDSRSPRPVRERITAMRSCVNKYKKSGDICILPSKMRRDFETVFTRRSVPLSLLPIYLI